MRNLLILSSLLLLAGCEPPLLSVSVVSNSLSGEILDKYSDPSQIEQRLHSFGFDCGKGEKSFPFSCTNGSDVSLQIGFVSDAVYVTISKYNSWPGRTRKAAEAIVEQIPVVVEAFSELTFQPANLSLDRNEPVGQVVNLSDVKASDFLK